MPDVYLIGELRMKNFEIFRLMQRKKDGWNYVLGFIVIEDCNRKTKVEDYPFLVDVYKNSNDFEGSDNIIKIKAIVAEQLNENEKEIVEHISVSLVEFKQNTDVTFSIVEKTDLDTLVDKLDEYPFRVYSELLQFAEARPNIEHFSKESLKRLFQE